LVTDSDRPVEIAQPRIEAAEFSSGRFTFDLLPNSELEKTLGLRRDLLDRM
jgi:hypothetical protein